VIRRPCDMEGGDDGKRETAARTEDAKAARRMLAIALVLEGWSRLDAAMACAMDRQTLRDWVHRYNSSGPDGLYDRPRLNGPLPRAALCSLTRRGGPT
jgi:hypothetical protein